MALTLMYITNHPQVARIAQDAGVDRVWVDLETIGKEERQQGMNTVKSFHKMEDVATLRKVLTTSQLLVRVNPIHEAVNGYCRSEEEIDEVVRSGADVVMLPMFKTVVEVERFVASVDGRARVLLLVETKEAVERIDEVLAVPGVDEVYIGLNDLHLAYGQHFMFEPLCDGKVERLSHKFREAGIPFGFGGIARVGYGMLPAEYIIAEHYRLGSRAAILSRSFCNMNMVTDPEEAKELFLKGVADIRARERQCERFTEADFAANHEEVVRRVAAIVSNARVKE
ncbi:MAG: aldolase [Bacteroidales bacterium]|nr:aldolase [Bacteroidales bacterium]